MGFPPPCPARGPAPRRAQPARRRAAGAFPRCSPPSRSCGRIATAFSTSPTTFCGLEVGRTRFPDIHAAVRRGAENYHRLAAPVAGCLDRPFGWVLSGWCRPAGRRGSAAVDLAANRRKPVTAFASTRHGFAVDLHLFGLRGRQSIDVALAGTNDLLEGGLALLGG